MSTAITGVVTNGVVVPSSPLPEGMRVEIHPQPARPEVPPELQEEFDGWEAARGPAPSKWSNVSRRRWTPMKEGEIWRVQIPAAPGHAQSGQRPAIIVQELAYNNLLPTTLIVPLTGQLAASRFAGTLVIQPDPQNGLATPSVALVFQIASSRSERSTRQSSTKSSTCSMN